MQRRVQLWLVFTSEKAQHSCIVGRSRYAGVQTQTNPVWARERSVSTERLAPSFRMGSGCSFGFAQEEAGLGLVKSWSCVDPRDKNTPQCM